jgi:hypothetical protein
MISTKSVPKSSLEKLPEEVLRLIGMGQYSLYEVAIEGHSDVAYALRTGAKKFYLLNKDGEPVNEQSSVNFSIKSKILIRDANIQAAVPNLCLQR